MENIVKRDKHWVYFKFPNDERVYKTAKKHCVALTKLIDTNRENEKMLANMGVVLAVGETICSRIESVGEILQYIVNNPSSIRFFPQKLIYSKCLQFRKSIERNYDIIPHEKRRMFLMAVNDLELVNGKNPNRSEY